MKIKRLEIKNIGMIADETIECNKPLLIFYGEVRQGKTTILNAVRWVCGGSYPADIIRHGQKEASITLEFDDGSLSRSWYIAKDGSTKSRPIALIRHGKPVREPTEAIKALLNPFMLNQDYLRNMSEPERRRLLVQLFGAETPELDQAIKEAESKAAELRSELKYLGKVDLQPVEKPDIQAAENKRAAVLDDWQKELARAKFRYAADKDAWSLLCKGQDERNQQKIHQREVWLSIQTQSQNIRTEITRLENVLRILVAQMGKEPDCSLETHPPEPVFEAPAPPDTSLVDAELDIAYKNQQAYCAYLNAVEQNHKRLNAEEALKETEGRLRDLRKNKLEALQKVGAHSGIPGLVFLEDGDFKFEDTSAGMLSTSQIMRLSEILSQMYPEGLGVDLIDRAESLGKTIFTFIEEAKAKQKTIMAAIVGERPATCPPEVGVFVVKDGRIQGQ